MRKFYDRYLKNLHPAIGIIFFLITVVFFIYAMFWASWDNLKKAEDIKQRVQEREEKLEKEILDSQLITDNSGQEVLNMMEQHANQTVAASAIIGISCWGDEFMDSNDSPIYSYPVILSQRLAENGKNIPVVNRGLYEA